MAASKQKAPRKTRAAALDPTPRHLWLAALGLLVAARRESEVVVSRASRKLEVTMADARYSIRRAEADLRAGVDGIRSKVGPPVQKFGGEVESRLAPIVARLGLKPKGTRKPRAGGATMVSRRGVRKPAKRVARKVAR